MSDQKNPLKQKTLPMFFRRVPRGKTASGHKPGRYWNKKGVKKG